MSLDININRLIPLSGVGRVGPQGRVFTLGTNDATTEVVKEGYIDPLVNKKTPVDNRQIFGGDLVFVTTEYLNPVKVTWGSFIVEFDATKDTYTLKQINLGPTA